MDFRKTIEDKILFILFTYQKEIVGNTASESAFDIIRKHGLKFEDFADPINQALYKSIQNQLLSGLSDVDFVNIVAYRPKEFKTFEQQANQYLQYITNLTSTTYSTFSELDKLIYKLKEFNLKDFWRYTGQTIISSNFDDLDILQFGNAIIENYNTFYGRLTAGILDRNSGNGNIGEELERKMNAVATGKRIGVPIHMPTFQDFFGGWQAPDLIIIGARPSMGKTSFILAITWESAKFSHIAFFTFEVSVNQLKNKIANNLTGIEYNRIERAQITREEFVAVKQAYDMIEASKLEILGIQFKKIEDLKLECKRLHRLGKLDCVVIDYLQLMVGNGNHGSREQEISFISRSLKELAIELNVPIIPLAQLGRDCESRPNKRPILSDLRESGAIEQDADIVSFLYRDAYYFDKNIDIPYETQFRTEFIVAKGRNVGTTNLIFFNDVKAAKVHDNVNWI